MSGRTLSSAARSANRPGGFAARSGEFSADCEIAGKSMAALVANRMVNASKFMVQSQTSLQRPDRLAGNNRPDCSAFDGPTVEGIVAAAAFALLLVNRPLEARIGDGYVGGGAGAERAAVEAEELCRILGVELDQAREIDCFPFVNKDVEEEAELGLQAKDAEGCDIEFDLLLVPAMRSVIAREDSNCAVGDSLDERLDMLLRAKRRVHLEVGVVGADRIVGECYMMRANLARERYSA